MVKGRNNRVELATVGGSPDTATPTTAYLIQCAAKKWPPARSFSCIHQVQTAVAERCVHSVYIAAVIAGCQAGSWLVPVDLATLFAGAAHRRSHAVVFQVVGRRVPL